MNAWEALTGAIIVVLISLVCFFVVKEKIEMANTKTCKKLNGIAIMSVWENNILTNCIFPPEKH